MGEEKAKGLNYPYLTSLGRPGLPHNNPLDCPDLTKICRNFWKVIMILGSKRSKDSHLYLVKISLPKMSLGG
jgi:hypothetical protein